MNMDNLLLEIGTEEIPAGYIEPALEALAAALVQKLGDFRISCGTTRTFGTPRRLAVLVNSVADCQETQETEILGPSTRVGLDGEGNPTVAARKFSEKTGVPLNRMEIKKTPKGDYLYARITEPSEPSEAVLEKILPDILLSTPFPKSMKWGSQHIFFARPIHSVLALLGTRIVSFRLGDISSGRITMGHRFMRPGPISVKDPSTYESQLREADVLVDIEERKVRVIQEIERLAETRQGRAVPDPELVNIVTNLVEYPVGIVGQFDQVFLELPDEVLITSMREHQKYFALLDNENRLMNAFIAINNTAARNLDVVSRGHERVLRARLNDARFFYRADLEIPLHDHVEKLKGVLFQARLGSMYDKTIRIQRLTEQLCNMARLSKDMSETACRAGFLCKADLVTQLVVEFPKLQGVMGRVYALKSGESIDTAKAIEEHYRPTFSGGPLAETLAGAVVGIADKLDSICGCFHAGLIPTGASDPYALRRQSIGVVLTMLHHNLLFSLREAIQQSLMLYGLQDSDSITDSINEFFLGRITNILSDQGFSRDVVAAATSVSIDHIPHLWARVRALETLKNAPDFEPLAVAFKRVVNLIRKTELPEDTTVQTRFFEHETEMALYRAFQNVHQKTSGWMDHGDFSQALQEMAGLRTSVDAFFDAVLVMTENVEVRNNRLALLSEIAHLFGRVGDFSRISSKDL